MKALLITDSLPHYKPEDIAPMRKVGAVLAHILDVITPYVQEGITTRDLDKHCHRLILENEATPSCIETDGYPYSACISINHVACHGAPCETVLRWGDIVNIDTTINLDGWHADASRMYWVGDVSAEAKHLTEVTYNAMMLGIEQVKPGATLGDVGYHIQSYAEKHGYCVVREYCGHGIGRTAHELPNVPHIGRPGEGLTLKEGMLFTIEPIVNAGKPAVMLTPNDPWTVVTQDRSLSAQWEHTVAVTKDGVEILTLSPKGYTCPPY